MGVKCVYDETISIRSLGDVEIKRASHVEPNENGMWVADLSPVNGPIIGPFNHRTDALNAEVSWLKSNWLRKY